MIEKELSEQSKGNVTFDTFVPLSQAKKQLPDFPIKALPQQVRTYIEAVTESLQVPVDMVACDVLGVISLCVQGKFQIEVKEDWTEPLNLYLATIMRPSERKSPTLKYVTQPVFDYVKSENERRKPAIEQYEFEKRLLKDKLEKKQRDFVNGKKDVSKEDVIACQTELTELEETKPLQLILDDVTPEALTKAMKDNDERMGIISAEGGIFSIMSGRYTKNTANIDIFLKAYSCEYYSTCRIGRSENELNHPCLTMILSVQPKIIMDVMNNQEFSGRGLLARFLYSMPNTKVGTRIYRTNPVPQKVKENYNDLVSRLLDIPDMFGAMTIRLSSEADYIAETFNMWIEQHLTNELEPIEEWAGKLSGNSIRIAGLLHVIQHGLNSVNVPLNEDTMKCAVQIAGYFLKHAQEVFETSGITESEDIRNAKYIISTLKSVTTDKRDKCDNRLDFITKRDLLRKCRRFKNVSELDEALEVLIDHGYVAVRVITPVGGGRTTEQLFINPKCWDIDGKETDGI